MTRYVMREIGVSQQEADQLRAEYWRDYGTTLAGLMRVHNIDPDPYLHDVHDIDFSVLSPDPALADLITALPGRKIVYTNGSAPYARQVLAARGLSAPFKDIFGIEHAGYLPKPERAAFDTVFAKAGLNPETSAMFEDDPRNLEAPHHMGLKTVHVAPEPETAPYLQHHTADLGDFLQKLL